MQRFQGRQSIAEGAAGRTRQEFSNFLSNAVGSLNEIDTQLELALRFGYVTEIDYYCFYKLLDECLALTYGAEKVSDQKRLGSGCSLLTAYSSPLTAYCSPLTAHG